MELLKVEDIAKELRISKLTVKRWIRDGKLKAIRISTRGDSRVKREELDKFIKLMSYES